MVEKWTVSSAELRRARTDQGLSQRDLARRSGLHQKTISKLERRPNPSITARTARALTEGLSLAAEEAIFRRTSRPEMPRSKLTSPWALWLKDRRLLQESTVEDYMRALHRLEVHAGRVAEDVSIQELSSFLRSDAGHAVKQQSFVAYRMFHRWGALQQKWPLDPELAEMRLPKVRVGPQPSLEVEDAQNLVAAATTPLQVRFVYLGLYAGLRLAEICDVDKSSWEGRIISVRVKGGWTHRLPAHPRLIERRDEILSMTPERRQVQRACNRLRGHVGLPMTPHWLRRTFAEQLVAQGVERDVVGALLGHTPGSITVIHYAPVTWREMVAAVNRLDYTDIALAS